MKALFFTILIFGAVFVAYDYFLAAPWERLLFERGARPSSPTVTAAAPQPAPGNNVPARVLTPKPAEDYTPSIPKIPSRDFEPPAIPSLETLTKNWTSLPAHAFPRQVKLREAVEVRMSAGASKLAAGATVFALASDDQGNLTIAPTETSSARGIVGLAKTDIPDQLRLSYEVWKEGRIAAARKAWLARKTAVGPSSVMASEPEPVSLADALDPATGKPLQSGDGSYPLLVSSIRSGRVTEITLAKIKSWGRAEQKDVAGLPTWVVDVWFDTVVFCGPITAQAQAQVRNGKVLAWLYPSGEAVP